jgi:hypothetical protein
LDLSVLSEMVVRPLGPGNVEEKALKCQYLKAIFIFGHKILRMYENAQQLAQGPKEEPGLNENGGYLRTFLPKERQVFLAVIFIVEWCSIPPYREAGKSQSIILLFKLITCLYLTALKHERSHTIGRLQKWLG